MAIQFSTPDLEQTPSLERVLRQFQSAIESQGKTISAQLPNLELINQIAPLIRSQLQVKGTAPLNLQSLPGTSIDASQIQSGTLSVARGGTGSGTASGARTNLGAAQSQSPGGPHTITLAKITGGGTNGSITFNAEGVITAFVDPT